uniref:Uncharacterized protein n=1 Tax=Meloidogyne enterolobii TaxID=390850 RepID=A0A6V7UIT6_MELEN|nr:unnamed protein product [Meloidogyne enterolobii]
MFKNSLILYTSILIILFFTTSNGFHFGGLEDHYCTFPFGKSCHKDERCCYHNKDYCCPKTQQCGSNGGCV